MSLKIWGTTPFLQATAHGNAARGWSRRNWEFVDIKDYDGPDNPLTAEYGSAIAAEEGDGWAYVIRQAGGV